MQVAIPVYPRFTALDIIGPYEILARLPDTEAVFVAENPGLIGNDLQGLTINVVAGLADVPNPDLVLVGGGPGQVDQMSDGRFHEWLRTVDRTSAWTASVCTGTLILAAAGLLDGRRATTHWAAFGQLAELGAIPTNERVVVDGHYASAAGVSAGIDLALRLAGSTAGDLWAQTVQLIVEYAPDPPYAAGSLDSAPAEVVENARRKLAARFPSSLAPRSR